MTQERAERHPSLNRPLFVGIRPIETRAVQLRIYPPISRLEAMVFVVGIGLAAAFGWWLS